MAPPRISRLLAFARELQRAGNFYELMVTTREEVAASLGYAHAWLFVADEGAQELRLIDVAGGVRDAVWEKAPVLRVAGDAMIEEILGSDEPVVVEDARTDPRTDKKMVELLGNRTIINVPLRLLDKPLGALGIGTFGDEGVRLPTPEQLDYLIGMASQLAVAAGRIRFLEERAQAAARLARAEEQLRHAQKMEAIGNLAGGVAHDFNNLLSVILSYSALLLMKLPEGAPMRSEIQEIERAGERAADLTRQLLAFGRHQVVEPRILDLGEVVASMEGMIRRLVGADIDVRVLAQPGSGRVKADPGYLEQVIMNLVVNARDAMPRGGTLTIQTSEVELDEAFMATHLGVGPGRYSVLSVTDTGSGMDKALQERIFEPFFTTKPQGKGTGLGLSTVYGIVRQSGGTIWVYSEPGLGSTFKIYLPRTNAEVSSAPQPVEVSTVEGTETVLLAEDEEPVRDVAKRILEGSGYRVLVAADAAEAARLCDEEPGEIHLLLTDVVMPGMSGPALVDLVAARRPEMRFLFMSGYTESAAVRARGGVPLLQKPLTPDTLLRKVREILDAP